jgi:putative glutamine amidotransferase
MSSETVPLIALSTYRQPAKWASWDCEAAVLQTSYIDCIAEAGGRPVMLPPAHGLGASAESVSVVADRLDALILVGGADVDPSRYGAPKDPATGELHPWRDENELLLLEAFLTAEKPVLTICRGTQILNTFAGGTLHQDLPGVIDNRTHQPGPGLFGEVTVNAEPESRIAEALGLSFGVQCSHHQAIDELGEGLLVTARSEDGVIEAVEAEDRFLVGVQWHPEQSRDTRLFAALVAAC